MSIKLKCGATIAVTKDYCENTIVVCREYPEAICETCGHPQKRCPNGRRGDLEFGCFEE